MGNTFKSLVGAGTCVPIFQEGHSSRKAEACAGRYQPPQFLSTTADLKFDQNIGPPNENALNPIKLGWIKMSPMDCKYGGSLLCHPCTSFKIPRVLKHGTQVIATGQPYPLHIASFPSPYQPECSRHLHAIYRCCRKLTRDAKATENKGASNPLAYLGVSHPCQKHLACGTTNPCTMAKKQQLGNNKILG